MAEKKNYWASTIAFLLLIVLPAGSYLYLKKGFSYRKQSIVEMTPIDSLDWSVYTTRHGLGQDGDLMEKIVIAVFIKNTPDLKDKAPTIKALHDQFGARQEVKFALVNSGDAGVTHFTEREILDDIYVLDGYRDQQVHQENLTLIDQQGRVRGYYNINERTEMQKLVRHIAVLLPLEQKQKLDLIRKSD